MKHCITDVEVSDHALERTDGEEKSRCRIPRSVLKRYVRERKGKQRYDKKTETMHFIVGKTVIAADYKPDRDVWKIATAYRMENAVRKRPHRYSDVDPSDFKRSCRENQ